MTWIKAKIAAIWIVAATVVASTSAIAVHKIVTRSPAPASPPLSATTVLALANPPAAPAAPADPAATTTVNGVILNPDEQPAVGAEVFIVMPPDPASDRKMREIQARAMAGERIPPDAWPKRDDTIVRVYDENWPAGTKSADTNGRFTFDNIREPWRLVARTLGGYAEVSNTDFKANNGQVILRPWGKVEGRLMVGADPQPNQKIYLERIGSHDDWIAQRVMHSLFVMSDKEGKFSFNAVAPGESLISWEPRGNQLRRLRHTLVDIEPGKTSNVDIGGKGRPVIGHAAVIPSNAPNKRITWANLPNQSVSASYYNKVGTTLPTPPGWNTMTNEQRDAWVKNWEKSPAGKKYRSLRWAEDFDMQPDGSFRIDDLLPGTYGLQFRILRTENSFGEDLVECWTEFTVPPLPNGVERMDEPLDIGTVESKLKPRTVVGEPAPDFSVTTLEGKTIKLSDYKGKYVVLKWWFSWNEMDTEAPAMKKAYEKMTKEGNWELINLHFDNNGADTKKRVDSYKLPGIQSSIADYTRVFPKEYLGSPSTLCIIGPDGKVAGRNLHAISLDSEIAKIVLEKK